MNDMRIRCLAILSILVVGMAIGCGRQNYFEFSLMSTRSIMLEDVVLSSDKGQHETFGFLTMGNSKNLLLLRPPMLPGETVTVTWVEEGRKHSAKIILTSTNVGPKGIQIEIKADGSLNARPKWHSL